MAGGCNIEGEEESWDFGTGAGFYVDATEEPWKTNYRMYSYVKDEVSWRRNALCSKHLSLFKVILIAYKWLLFPAFLFLFFSLFFSLNGFIISFQFLIISVTEFTKFSGPSFPYSYCGKSEEGENSTEVVTPNWE